MAKYTGPVCRLCRREGEKLYLKGARCLSVKCPFEKQDNRRDFAPGQHGRDAQFKRNRSSDFLQQLREKQKARRVYGVLESQFRRYYEEALKSRGVNFEICEITLRNRGLKKDQFIMEADFTPSGVVRITKLQHQGYAYLRP